MLMCLCKMRQYDGKNVEKGAVLWSHETFYGSKCFVLESGKLHNWSNAIYLVLLYSSILSLNFIQYMYLIRLCVCLCVCVKWDNMTVKMLKRVLYFDRMKCCTVQYALLWKVASPNPSLNLFNHHPNSNLLNPAPTPNEF